MRPMIGTMIDRRVFADHHDRLVTIVGEVHRASGSIVSISFIGYGLATYVWWRDHIILAMLIATLAYALFRAFRPLSLYLARKKLAARAGFAETFAVLDAEFAARGARDVFAEVEALIEATHSSGD